MSDKSQQPSHPSPPQPAKASEKSHIFDNPQNVKRLLRIFYTTCAALFGAEFFIHRHLDHAVESWYGFYAIYGFVACVALVLAAKELRKAAMRKEDYYD
jgi:hypothetical protein